MTRIREEEEEVRVTTFVHVKDRHMLRRIPNLFLRCLNLFGGYGTLARRGRYVMLHVTLLIIINVIMRHMGPTI